MSSEAQASGAWSVHDLGDGIAELRFDTPGEKVNIFTAATMAELETRLGELAGRSGLRALVVTSGKPESFIVGADIREIRKVWNTEEAMTKVRGGQRVFSALAALPCPTVVAVNGACMGGGTEMALACDWRLMSDHPRAAMGLPEVRLGILPAWGGCQRLPRLVGLAPALDVILTGRSLDGRKARAIGLADEVVPHALLRERALAFARERAAAGGKRTASRRRGAAGLVEATAPGRAALLAMARRGVDTQTHGNYPAPYAAIEAIGTGLAQGMAAGFEAEARGVAGLLSDRVAHYLVDLFWQSEEIKKRTGVEDPAVRPRPVQRVAVLGAGTMGGGIAQLAADKDLAVRLKDVAWSAIGTGLAAADKVWARRVSRRRLTRFEHARKRALVTGTLDYTGFGTCDVVFEAVVENMDVKRAVLAECEARLPESAIFASNTSSLSVADLAAAARRPERVAGFHFFNPVDKMPLVEIIAGPQTSDEAIATLFQLAKDLGKTPVVVRDSPGFLVNRILLPYMNEAVHLVAEGTPIAAVDGAMTAFGMPMGPLALIDEVGIDVAVKAGGRMAEAFRDHVEPAAGLQAVYESGRLGRKNGRGFYGYTAEKRGAPDPEVERLVRGSAAGPIAIDSATLTDRMALSMVNEAARCLDEGIVGSAAELDLAMVFGTGFPPFRGGPLHYADALGAAALLARLRELASRFGPRFAPAPLIEKLASAGGTFH